MRAPSWYPAWREDALRELVAKTERLKHSHQLGAWPRFDFDPSGTLTFSDGGVPQVICEVQAVGTTTEDSWMWCWANPGWEGCCIDEMQQVRAFGEEHGIEELTTATLEDEDLDALGWALTAVAVRVLDGVGAYRPPDDTGRALFVVCKSMEFVS